MLEPMYAQKAGEYFDLARREIAPLLPQHLGRVLEIGAGSGATLAWLKHAYGAEWVGGIELMPEAANRANPAVDQMWCGDIESMRSLPVNQSSLDCVLCLDVLEHLRDPWTTANRLAQLLAPSGVLIASIPNVQCIHNVRRLLRGRWDYQDSGLLDRTHLRFFTRATAISLIRDAGLRVDMVRAPSLETRGKERLANRLTFGLFSDFFAVQFLIRGIKA